MKRSLRKKLSKLFLFSYFIVSIVEVIAEMYYDEIIIWFTKPLLIPLLIGFYFTKSKKKDVLFIVAMLFSLLGNLLLTIESTYAIVFGSFCLLVYRIGIIMLVIQYIKKPSTVKFLIGMIPFLLIYGILIYIKFYEIETNIYMFFINAFFVVYLGGYSLGKFIETQYKSVFLLFISTLLFALVHFVYLLKLFSEEKSILYAFSMIFYVLAQYIITLFLIHAERRFSKNVV